MAVLVPRHVGTAGSSLVLPLLPCPPCLPCAEGGGGAKGGATSIWGFGRCLQQRHHLIAAWRFLKEKWSDRLFEVVVSEAWGHCLACHLVAFPRLPDTLVYLEFCLQHRLSGPASLYSGRHQAFLFCFP